MTLEFYVLGAIEVRRRGELVALGGPQQRRVFAALLAERGRLVSVDRLVDAVWPDAPPDGARRTVMTYISRLRLALGDGHIVTQAQGYRIEVDTDAVDAGRFELLAERARTAAPTQAVSLSDSALGLWRGGAFGEFADEWWALPHATRLEELRLVASERRADALVAVGESGRAVADLEGLVASHPLRERSVAQLMTSYEASGRQADALRVYARYRNRLAEETGLDPSKAMRDLESSILAGSGAGSGRPVRSTRGYTLGEVIGEGAHASVYRATQPGVGREVAIKVIRAELSDHPGFVGRFEAEAQLVAKLEHPHIVPLYDFWREPGGAFLVFRLLRGGTASDVLRRDGPWPLDRVGRLVTEIGDALVTAHRAGVVHRDVKPTNVLFDEGGNAYLSDFGIATNAIDPLCGPADAPAVGSPLYAAPEQFRRAEPAPDVDQYSFAAMIWELLTGIAPFDGANSSTLLKAKMERPVGSVVAHRPDLPSEVDRVLQQATASRPVDRFADLADLLGAWQSAVHAGLVTTDGLKGEARASEKRRRAATTPVRVSKDMPNPYRGLRAFGEADARYFRGRDALVTRLVGDVTTHSLVAVVGASGSGKSSLVSAGLLPRLRAEGTRVASMVPGADPIGQLRLCLLSAAVAEPDPGDVAAMLRSVAAQVGGPLVVIIDQFEELWTLAPADERDRFAHGLASVVGEATEGSVRLVVTIRADFFDRPLAHPALGPLVAAYPFAVTPMNAQELHDAVVAPAASLGVVLEPGLDSSIVSEVVNQPASLPLLQFTMAELFDRRQGVVITGAAYESIGGIAGAVATRAEEIYSTLDGTGQEAVRHVLLRLVVPGEGTEDTRRRVRCSDLPPGSAAVVAQLETHRLLVADRDPATREPTVEIAHESLLRSWPRLRTWLAEDRDVIRQIQHVGAAAQAWAAASRADSELYRGVRLSAATEVLRAGSHRFTALERQFVRASVNLAQEVRERENRARVRSRRGFAATAVALVIALIAGSVALAQRHQAETQARAADVSRLVALAQGLSGTKRDLAMLLALEAARRDPGATTTGALQAALYGDPSFLRYLRTGSDLAGNIEFSPDGRYLYANPQDFDHSPVRVDIQSGRAEPVPVRDLDDKTWVAWFVPVDPGSALMTRLRETADTILPVERVDLADGHVLGTVSIDAEAGHVAISPDRTRAAVTTVSRAGEKARVVVLDLATMAVIESIDQPGPAYTDPGIWVGQSAWIDDRRLVVAGPSGRMLVWEPGQERILKRLNDPPAAHTADPFQVQVTPDRTQVVVAGSTMMAYDLTTGARSWPRLKQVAPAVAIDPLAHVVWAQEAGFGSSRLFAYDLATGERTQSVLDGQHGTVCDADVSPDAKTIALASCNEGSVAVWALDGASATGPALASRSWASSEDMWSPAGGYVALFRMERPNSVDVVDTRDGSRQHAEGIMASAVNSPIFRPDGILQTVNSKNHVVEFDPRNHSTRDTGIVLTSDGHVSANIAVRQPDLSIYGLDNGTVVLVDTGKGRIVRTIKTDLVAVYGVGWSPDGRRLFAAGQAERAEVFDVATGRKLATLPTPAANLVVRPGGDLLAAAAFDGVIRFVDTTTLEPVGRALNDGGAAFAAQLQFTPDGRTLITSGLDNTLRIFDVSSRRQLGVPIEIASWGAAISPDSRHIAVTTDRGVQRLAIDAPELRRAACRAAGRDLTATEWAQYVGGEPHRLCR